VRIAVDTGGTFTDFVVDDGVSVSRFKVPSTPKDPSQAIRSGFTGFADFELLHGTTVATNAILEGKTARVGLVVNESFRDLLRLGRQTRPSLYDWEPRLPEVPVRDEDIRTVAGRIGIDGSEQKAMINPRDFNLGHCDAVAVCLLFSYASAKHEAAVAEALGHRLVSCSHRVSPEAREYERMCATVLNAAVAPIMEQYLHRLDGISTRLGIMASHGGLISVRDAAALPIRTVVSGPAGGVSAAVSLAKRLSKPNVIAFDMGGTSTDVTLIHDYCASMTACDDIAGLPVRLNRVAVHTVGCGGGSIAFRDGAGALRVGPQSAGASPGPALYGGGLPTVTDADFVLGRLPLTRFAKVVGLDAANSARVVGDLASGLGLNLREAASAVVETADANMAAAVRKVSADRGFDPAGFALVAFGGAGGLHACAIADQLGIREVLVPAGAGVFSALGLLGAPQVWEASLGVLGTSAKWEATYRDLEAEAASHLQTVAANARFADMRYQGQAHDLTVSASGSLHDAERAFHEMHQRTFGIAFHERPVQWVTARVRSESAASDQPLLSMPQRIGEAIDGVIEREQVTNQHGPLVIVDDDCTVWVPAGWRAERLNDGTLRLTS
jgi:N-methylhydantoinase A